MKVERPLPPPSMLDDFAPGFLPAPEVEAWARTVLIDPAGSLYNPEHDHLQSAAIGFLWTSIPNARHMNEIAGQAEVPFTQGGKWAKARAVQQLTSWFGDPPDFLITLDARYASMCSDAVWCALVEHELLHCGQAKGVLGLPKFKRDGSPVFAIRGHDVEEFVSIVRRYGVGSAAGKTAELVRAAAFAPEVAEIDIAACCGTCSG